MVKRPLLFALALFVVALGVFLAIPRSAGPSRSGHAVGAPSSGGGVATAPPAQTLPPALREEEGRRVGPASSAAPRRMELPPPNTALGPVFTDLVRAARGGDPGAMCRLAFEMTRCGPDVAELRRNEADHTDELVYGEPDENQKSFLLRMLASNATKQQELEAICDGVKLPTDLKPWRLLRDAARAGHVPSMVRFGTELPIDDDTLFDNLDALASFRDEREAFLKEAAAAGNAKAALVLFRDCSGNGSSFMQSDRRDPVQALAYGIALDGVGSPDIRKWVSKRTAMLRRKLPEKEEREAERVAAALAPGLAGLKGEPVELDRPLSKSAEDCSATDPTTLALEPRRNPAGKTAR